jgi:uncharacterized membrane protein YkvA (DUF1232 family)
MTNRPNYNLRLLGAFAALLATGIIVISQFDLIPDAWGLIGLIDDVIILILGINLAVRIKNNGMKGFKQFFSSPFEILGNMLSKLKEPGTILSLLALGGAIWYFKLTYDLIPDMTPIYGHIDDIGVFLAALAVILSRPRLKNAIESFLGGKKHA